MTLAVVCAMDFELEHLRAALNAAPSQVLDARPAATATLNAEQVVLTASDLGMVGAAAATEAVITRTHPRAVLNYGCAGAHRADLLPGDIVVGTHVVAYDHLHEDPAGNLRYTGMYYVKNGRRECVQALAADPDLLTVAQSLAHTVEPWPVGHVWPPGIEHRQPRVVFGTIASADRWNRSPRTVSALVERHGSHCEDMEAAAIGLVCASHSVPFLSVKDISNNELLRATESGSAMVSEVTERELARRAAAYTLTLLRAISRTR